MSEVAHVREVIRAVNDCWLNGWYDQLDQYFDDSVVLERPGFAGRIEGREALIASYREFGERAHVRRFQSGTPSVHVRGDTAVCTAPFVVCYEHDGRSVEESGTDLLVFARADRRWVIVWRTVVMDSAAPAA